MMRKRLLCAIMALLLLFSAQPMAAAANTENQRSTVIKASCKLPIIKVTVPTSAAVYINPLRLPVSIGNEEESGQIVSTPACIANQSEVPIVVDATILGGINTGSTMKLSTTSTKGTGGTDKRAFIYFEMKTSNTEYPEDVQWDESYDAEKHILIVDRVPITKKGIVTLPAMTLDGEVAEGGYAPFRLTGDAVENPEQAWTSRDGIIVIATFTFTPLTYDAL